jgi:hypothetical protein
MNSSFNEGVIQFSDLVIPTVRTALSFRDIMGSVMVRCGINRDNYKVSPGLYAVGAPGPDSDVFVTGNYKLSFDVLRESLGSVNGWILVLDTRGVNVWCAAGKGTFSTKELVNRIRLVSLEKVVTHRRLILPQLSATGVAAYKVKEESGFNVHYGPVRASDIKAFVSAGYRADKNMRKVSFGFTDRIKLIPNDFIYSKYYLLAAMAVVFLIAGIGGKSFSLQSLLDNGGPAILKVFLAYVAGIVLTPLILPYIPGRHFSLKGLFSGAFIFIIMMAFGSAGNNIPELVSWFLIITAISSFLAMNFTGSSTFTSLSGVKKEMKIFVPLQIGFASIGLVLQIVGRIIQ